MSEKKLSWEEVKEKYEKKFSVKLNLKDWSTGQIKTRWEASTLRQNR